MVKEVFDTRTVGSKSILRHMADVDNLPITAVSEYVSNLALLRFIHELKKLNPMVPNVESRELVITINRNTVVKSVRKHQPSRLPEVVVRYTTSSVTMEFVGNPMHGAVYFTDIVRFSDARLHAQKFHATRHDGFALAIAGLIGSGKLATAISAAVPMPEDGNTSRVIRIPPLMPRRD